MALIGVMVLLMVLSVAISAMSVSGRTEITISQRHESAALAQAAAEAGLNHAIELVLTPMNQWQANGFANAPAAATGLLLGPDGAGGTVDTDADNGSLEAAGIPRPPAVVPLPGAGGTSYEARVFDEDDPARGLTLTVADIAAVGEDGISTTDTNSSLVVRAIGYGPEAATTTLEALIRPITLPAIVSNDRLRVFGNATIDGTAGSVHSNDDLELQGSPSVSGSATATGTYSETGNPSVGGLTGSGHAVITVPPIRAIDYRPQADFILQAGGVMVDQGGATICDASGNSNACKNAGYLWRFLGADGWRLGVNNVNVPGNHRTYYAETDLKIQASPGSAGNPLDVTLIAEGNIDVSGSPTIEANLPGTLFVTDGDLDVTGNLTQVGSEAQVLVHEQMRLSGSVELAGQIFIEDAADLSNLVTTSSIGGNSHITSNAALGPTVFTVSGWRELL